MNAKFPDNPLLGPLSRADFITEHLPLVKASAICFSSTCRAARIPFEDAISEGSIGLILAYDKYRNPSVDFERFAVSYIRGTIRKMFRQSIGPVRIPHNVYPHVRRAAALGLQDAPAEVLAEELGVSFAIASRVLIAGRAGQQSSALPDTDENGQFDDHTHLETGAFLARLKPNQQRVIRMLMADYTQTEVAQELGVTRQAVQKTMRKVRSKYAIYEKISA